MTGRLTRRATRIAPRMASPNPRPPTSARIQNSRLNGARASASGRCNTTRTSAAICSVRATCRRPSIWTTPLCRASARPRSRSRRAAASSVEASTVKPDSPPAEKRHVQPGEPTLLGGRAVVDAESGAHPGDGIGRQHRHDRRAGPGHRPAAPPRSGPASARPPRAGAAARTRRRDAPAPGCPRVMAPSRETSMSTSAPIRRRWFSSTERVVSWSAVATAVFSAKSPESRRVAPTSCWLRASSCRTKRVVARRSSSSIS